MAPQASRGRSVPHFVLVLFGLCVPVWVLGSIFDVQLLPGFELFQAGLAMPMFAAFILTAREQGRAGIVALLKRTADAGRIRPRRWLVLALIVFPSLGLIN